MGLLPSSITPEYGFGVFTATADADIDIESTYSVLITKSKARLAGWDLIPGALRSGTVADINGNEAKIALGVNATSTHLTPQPNLFYVSASASPIFFVGENFSYVNDVLTAAGWKIDTTSISKGTNIVLDADAEKISLNNNAMAFGYDVGGTDKHGILIDASTDYWYSDKNFRVGGANGIDYDGTDLNIGVDVNIRGKLEVSDRPV